MFYLISFIVIIVTKICNTFTFVRENRKQFFTLKEKFYEIDFESICFFTRDLILLFIFNYIPLYNFNHLILSIQLILGRYQRIYKKGIFVYLKCNYPNPTKNISARFPFNIKQMFVRISTLFLLGARTFFFQQSTRTSKQMQQRPLTNLLSYSHTCHLNQILN